MGGSKCKSLLIIPLSLAVISIVFHGCSTTEVIIDASGAGKIQDPEISDGPKPADIAILERILRDKFEEWKSTPHCMGGYSKKCIDCSGYVKKMYETTFGVQNLPRTVRGLATMDRGTLVSMNSLRAGDLVAFRQPRPWYPHHVGIYLSDKEFMHASKSRGVMISRIDNPHHWAKYFWRARRVLSDKDVRNIARRQ